MNKNLFFAGAVAGLLASGTVFAQGLPFSSDHNTSRSWGTDRAGPRDMTLSHANAPQPEANQAPAEQVAARH